MHGNFEIIEAGIISVALGELCGGVSKNQSFDKDDVQSRIRDGSLFKEIADALEKGNTAGASSHAGSDTDTDALGIVQGHAYSLLDAREVNVNNKSVQLVKLKNPWKTGEWKGDFSDGSKLWDERLKNQLKHIDADDGVFWMPFKDFVKHFSMVTLCHVFDSKSEKLSVSGQWNGESAGGCPNFPTTWNNPMWRLEVKERCKLFIVLVATNAHRDDEDICLGCEFFKNNGKKAVKGKFGKQAVSIPYSQSYTISAQIELDKDTKGYTVMPCTFQPNQ